MRVTTHVDADPETTLEQDATNMRPRKNERQRRSKAKALPGATFRAIIAHS